MNSSLHFSRSSLDFSNRLSESAWSRAEVQTSDLERFIGMGSWLRSIAASQADFNGARSVWLVGKAPELQPPHAGGYNPGTSLLRRPALTDPLLRGWRGFTFQIVPSYF